jgi:hypothetical protein
MVRSKFAKPTIFSQAIAEAQKGLWSTSTLVQALQVSLIGKINYSRDPISGVGKVLKFYLRFRDFSIGSKNG